MKVEVDAKALYELANDYLFNTQRAGNEVMIAGNKPTTSFQICVDRLNAIGFDAKLENGEFVVKTPKNTEFGKAILVATAAKKSKGKK